MRNPVDWWKIGWGPYHGGDAETELMEIELGERAAFDLFHHDDVMFDPDIP